MATITKRENGQWQAKVRRSGLPSLSKTFKLKRDAEAWAREIESESDSHVMASRKEADKTTLYNALQRYLDEVTPTKKGAKAERNRILVWQGHPLAKRYLSNLTSTDFAKYRDQRLAEGKSASTVRNELNVISALFNLARTEWGMISLSNPIQFVKKPSPGKGRDRRLMGDEERRLLNGSAYPLKQMIILAVETAMRLGELLSLEWKNIDLKKQTAVLEDTKNGERRIVPLSSRAVAALKETPRNIKGPVFPSVSNSYISHQFRELCGELEIEGLRFHDLRHEGTSRLFEKGFNPMEVSSITGHKTLVMLKRYTHLNAEDLAKRLG